MRAVVQDRYGSPDVLPLADVARPAPGPGQVLGRIEEAALNARAWHVMRGERRLARLMDCSTFSSAAREWPFAALTPPAGTRPAGLRMSRHRGPPARADGNRTV